MPVQKIFLLALLALATSCQRDADIRPANYDELALATGHWEWLATSYQSGPRTPTTEGYSRQLVFGAGSQLTLRRSGQADYATTYQLSMGTLPHCGTGTQGFPIVTYATQESQLPNNDRRTYNTSQRNGRQELSIVGEVACVDGGAYETYQWVAE